MILQILHEDADLLVVNKPADLVCHPTKADACSSLIGRVRLYLGEEAHPQFINRLDRETSGVVLIAKTVAAARELRQIWEQRLARKIYLAIVHGIVREDKGSIEAPLGRDEQSMVAIKDRVRSDGAPARTDYEVVRYLVGLEPSSQFTLLRVSPHTGRKHQIRIHLAHIGHPIVGDKLYGGDERIYLDFVNKRLTAAQRTKLILPNHALHAESVSFTWRNRNWVFQAEPEKWFTEFLADKSRGRDSARKDGN
jgi:23S rRNA pseudouridine1911/1915/1917 synthase